MRLVRVKAPEGKAADVARLAFEAGIPQVGTHRHESLRPDGRRETKDVVDVETATPTAKRFIDALMSADFFDPEEYSILVRQPRSIISRERPRRVTWPLVEPIIDVFQELWQFSHVTFGFVGRNLVAALLLAYGMLQQQLLIMIAGLLFLQFLPLLLAVGFGLLTRQWRLAGRGAFAFFVGTALLVAGGAAVALLAGPPLRYNEHNPLPIGLLISLGVGVAAALANADDAGRRELIGLAATAQIAIVPVWFGINLVFGFPAFDSSPPAQRALGFGLNVLTIIVAALVTYAALGMRGTPLRHFSRAGGR